MKKGDWICIIIALVIIEVACLWCIDISVSGMISSTDSIVTNGFRTLSLVQAYHIGIWGTILCMASLVFITVHIIHKEEWS